MRLKKEPTVDRIIELLRFDSSISASAKVKNQLVAGVDEVGRGCLAGPVMAAAVVLPDVPTNSELMWQLAALNDSKQVRAEDRVRLAAVLRSVCRFAIAEASVKEIDEINILHASLLAMRRAVRRLKMEEPVILAVDGNRKIPSIRMSQVTVVDGDTKSAAIAAASIIAKVHRDQFMIGLAERFPTYKWDSNKGYRSRDHWEALDKYGMSKWHRRTFVEHWLQEATNRKTALPVDEDANSAD